MHLLFHVEEVWEISFSALSIRFADEDVGHEKMKMRKEIINKRKFKRRKEEK